MSGIPVQHDEIGILSGADRANPNGAPWRCTALIQLPRSTVQGSWIGDIVVGFIGSSVPTNIAVEKGCVSPALDDLDLCSVPLNVLLAQDGNRSREHVIRFKMLVALSCLD